MAILIGRSQHRTFWTDEEKCRQKTAEIYRDHIRNRCADTVADGQAQTLSDKLDQALAEIESQSIAPSADKTLTMIDRIRQHFR